jgi:hypothetical protein
MPKTPAWNVFTNRFEVVPTIPLPADDVPWNAEPLLVLVCATHGPELEHEELLVAIGWGRANWPVREPGLMRASANAGTR